MEIKKKTSQVKSNLFKVSLNLSLWMKLRFHGAWGGLAKGKIGS